MDREFIDIYCERVGPAFWGEPLNAVSNLAFMASAALLILFLHRNKNTANHDLSHWVLITLILLIGIGSSLFHTLAVRWTMWADIIPITLFIVAYSYLALTHFLSFSMWKSLSWTVAVLALTAGLPAASGLRGSTYLSALIGMFTVGFFLRRADLRRPGTNPFFASGCIFALSLVFRALDAPLCDIFPNGTHYFWHLLNAVVLFFLTRAFIQTASTRSSN